MKYAFGNQSCRYCIPNNSEVGMTDTYITYFFGEKTVLTLKNSQVFLSWADYYNVINLVMSMVDSKLI